MTRLRWALLLLGVFLLGTAVGAVTMRAGHGFFHSRHDPDRMEHLAVERIARRLGLDAAQRQALEEVTHRTRQQFEALRSEVLPKMEAILDRAAQDLQSSLRPDQQQELDKIREEARDRLRHRLRP